MNRTEKPRPLPENAAGDGVGVWGVRRWGPERQTPGRCRKELPEERRTYRAIHPLTNILLDKMWGGDRLMLTIMKHQR